MIEMKRKNKERKFLDELHLLIITFLKKLSIFTENKDEMVRRARSVPARFSGQSCACPVGCSSATVRCACD